MVQTVGLIGLGNMGLPMAQILRRKGHAVRGFDLDAKRRAAAADSGVALAASHGDVFASCALTLLSLPNAAAVRAVVEGTEGFIGRAARDSIVVDTSTSEPPVTRALARGAAAAGLHMLDAPVSGGTAGAASGTLAMMVGGDADILARARPVLAELASKIVHIGGPGAGHVAKLVNNLLVAANLLTVAEAFRLGKRAGLDLDRLLEAVNGGTGRSSASEVNLPRWVLSGAFDSGFTMALMRKDVGLALKLARELGENPKVLSLVDVLWQGSVDSLPGGEDFNRIAARILDRGAIGLD
jgi:3-hydroxyisobutyrate dehydrogenase